jgi:hypothetical protein
LDLKGLEVKKVTQVGLYPSKVWFLVVCGPSSNHLLKLMVTFTSLVVLSQVFLEEPFTLAKALVGLVPAGVIWVLFKVLLDHKAELDLKVPLAPKEPKAPKALKVFQVVMVPMLLSLSLAASFATSPTQ